MPDNDHLALEEPSWYPDTTKAALAAPDIAGALGAVARAVNTHVSSPVWDLFTAPETITPAEQEKVLSWLQGTLERVPKDSEIGALVLMAASLETFFVEMLYARCDPLADLDDEETEVDWRAFPRRDACKSAYLDAMYVRIYDEDIQVPRFTRATRYVFLVAYVIGLVRIGLDRLPLALWLGDAPKRTVHVLLGEGYTPVVTIAPSGWTPLV